MEKWQVIICALFLGVAVGIAFGCTWNDKKYQEEFEDAVDKEVESRVTHIKQLIEKKAYESIVGNYKEDKPEQTTETEKREYITVTTPPDIHLISREEYEGTNDSAENYYFEKVDLSYSEQTRKLFETFEDSALRTTEFHYTDERVCPFLKNMSFSIPDKSFIYIRDEQNMTDYRIMIRIGGITTNDTDESTEKKEV